jgi:beta-lactamase superfamily II metal-dependent hydrolase
MVATHTDADHIGGLAAVLNSFNVLDVWTNGQSVSTATYTTFAGAVKGSGASTHVGRRGDKIAVGQLSFSILNPIDLTGTTNNNSIVLSLNWGDTGFLFEGDAEQGAESSMLSAGIVPHAEILKVGHHGSRTASSPPFLAVVKPEVAVYMAGVGNRYGHPHIETIDALYQIGAKVYGTDVNGTIKIETDGKTYTVQPSKGTANMPKAVGQTPSLTSLSPTSNKVAATDDGPFVGSKNSNVYHYPSCSSAKRISPPNLITFNSSADACSHGYRPCEICKPP